MIEIVYLLHVVNQTLFFNLPSAYFHKRFDTMVTSEKCKYQINGYISLHKTSLSILLSHGILLNSSFRETSNLNNQKLIIQTKVILSKVKENKHLHSYLIDSITNMSTIAVKLYMSLENVSGPGYQQKSCLSAISK